MQAMVRTVAWGVSLLGCVGVACGRAATAPEAQKGCRMVVKDKRVELHSPFFVFRLDAAAGLRAESWENRMTGRTISLAGAELELDIGETPKAARTLQLHASQLPAECAKAAGQAVFKLTAKAHDVSALLTYQWDAKRPVLRKFVDVTNAGEREVRLLNVRLGGYRTGAKVSGGARGFPVYLDGEFFMSLAHPAGWATGAGGQVSLRHYPGARLGPGKTLRCMEAVYGVGRTGEARQSFLAHVRGRMRRAVRKHDKPYAIYEPFGGRANGDFNETEEFLLDNIAKVAEGQRESGCRFDYYSVDFWVDARGDLKRFDPVRFPRGFAPIRQALKELGALPGLWIDSGGLPQWTIGRNPAVKPAMSRPDGAGQLCRASEPIKSMYTRAFIHHMKENGVRLLKFDNLGHNTGDPVCNHPGHDHLPGVYSTEAIHEAVIEFLGALDAACPDVFLMLYWGYKSPWWLLHADTLFEPGLRIEAASPAAQPAPYARDSVTQRLDQAQWHCKDIPALGKDSLGIWLSSWPWNSCVGKGRWQEGVVMDICRGSLLAQIWTDTPWLSPPERKQLAEFIALLKARPECFGNPRFILGNPWKDEPYGYCCTDGKRAFLALNNCSWTDSSLTLTLNAAWGLPDGRAWDIYRWYPDPARLTGNGKSFGEKVSISLRPFQVVLLEAVPAGATPTLRRSFNIKPIPAAFPEPTRAIELDEGLPRVNEPKPAGKSIWTLLTPASAVSAGGATLRRQKDGSILAGGKNPSNDTYTVTAQTPLTGITAIRLEALCDASLPVNGPGRAVNGNFALHQLRLTAAPQGKPDLARPVKLRSAKADFSQSGYGGWPVEAAIDGDPKTGWSVDPDEGWPHVAVFETAKAVGLAGGTRFTFTLELGERGHSIGRLRLSATTAKPPVPLPTGYGGPRTGPPSRIIKAQLPPSAAGGTLVVTLKVHGGSPRGISCGAKLGDRPVPCTKVWHDNASYPATWQAWRIPVGPSARPRPLLLSVSKVPPKARLTWAGYFLPR